MVAENDDATAEPAASGGDAAVHLLVREAEISLRQRLPLGDAVFLVCRENGQQHGRSLCACETFLKPTLRKSQAISASPITLGRLLSITPGARPLFRRAGVRDHTVERVALHWRPSRRRD